MQINMIILFVEVTKFGIITLMILEKIHYCYFRLKKKNIVYVASFGVSSIPNNYIDIYKEGLNNFKNIS